MTALADACADYAAAVPLAQALTAIPDTDGTTSRGQPASRPPWNPAAATALLDALEGARQLEAAWRSQAAGRPVPRRAMAHTGAVLASILRLAHAVSDSEQRNAVTFLTRSVTVIHQLRAVDKAERPKVIPGACPYCIARDEGMRGKCMLVVFERSGRVRCFFAGYPCTDGDGNPPSGVLERSALDGTACIAWDDGLVT